MWTDFNFDSNRQSKVEAFVTDKRQFSERKILKNNFCDFIKWISDKKRDILIMQWHFLYRAVIIKQNSCNKCSLFFSNFFYFPYKILRKQQLLVHYFGEMSRTLRADVSEWKRGCTHPSKKGRNTWCICISLKLR